MFSNIKNGSNNNLINYYPYFSTPTPAPPPFTGEGNRNRVKSISLYRKRGRDARVGEKLSNISNNSNSFATNFGTSSRIKVCFYENRS